MLRVSRTWGACYAPCVHVWNVWTFETHLFNSILHEFDPHSNRSRPAPNGEPIRTYRQRLPQLRDELLLTDGVLEPTLIFHEGPSQADETGPDDGLARPGGRHAMQRPQARTTYCWFAWLLLL